MEPLTLSSGTWNVAQRTAFRFFFNFLLLYIAINPIAVLSEWTLPLYKMYIEPVQLLATWTGQHVLHLQQQVNIEGNGSGDKTYDYITLLIIAVLSVTGTIIWSAADSGRKSYNRLLYWLSVMVRFYLALIMLSYGLVKVFKLQFPYPDVNRLKETFGEASPMGLAWTFLGYSKGYNYFMGFAELSGGMLLFFRRTAALGAVITLGVAANIMAVNYCFDVPVKLLSTMLVVMSAFLIAGDLRRFVNFFILNKTVYPVDLSEHKFKIRWQNVTAVTLKYVFIAYMIFSNVTEVYSAFETYNKSNAACYGEYTVQSEGSVNNNSEVIPNDTRYWKKLTITPETFTIEFINGMTSTYSCNADQSAKQLILSEGNAVKPSYTLIYNQPQDDILILKGKFINSAIDLKLSKINFQNSELMGRGYHWINEYPYNR
jgi:hypothetical protein